MRTPQFGLVVFGLSAALACDRSSPPPAHPEEVPVASEEQASAQDSGMAEEAAPSGTPQPEACAEIELTDCATQGALLLISEAPEQAVQLLAWSCEQGVGEACSNLAVGYRSERLDPIPAQELLALDEQGCNAGWAASCRMVGIAYYEGEGVTQDITKAQELFEKACTSDDAKSCLVLGIIFHEGSAGERDQVKALASFEHGCELRDGTSCKNAGLLHHGGEAGGADPAKAAARFEEGCKLDEAEACFNLGVLLSQDEDLEGASTWMARACELGDQDGCAAVEKLAEAADPNAVANANVSMGGVEVDGMALTNIQCRISGGGGLFGSMALFAVLAEKKRAFDKCAPKGAAPTVRWSFEGNKTKVLGVEDPSSKVAACVEKVMTKLPATMTAECRATLLIGDRKGAEAAAQKNP